jgi:hypothetical protein
MPLRVVKLIHLRSCENLYAMPNMLAIFYIRMGDVYLSNMKCLCMWSVIWCLSCLLYVMHCPLHFHVFKHLHLGSHLGTLDAPREGHDVELNPKMVLVDPSRRWKDPGMHAWSGDVVKTVQANLTDLCRIPGKPQSIISLLISEMQLSIMLYILIH